MAMKPSHGAGRTAPRSDMVSPREPRYDYAAPTIKKQFGKPPALGYDIAAYKLPDIDVQTQMRNFPGYTESQPYSLDDIRMGDTSGTTETDSKTDPKGSGGYTRINSRANAPKPGTKR